MISVFRDWTPDAAPVPLGALRAVRGKRSEIFEFTFAESEVSGGDGSGSALDPDVRLVAGPQYPADGRSLFGMFEDSSPDRWGRLLIRRRFERDRRLGRVDARATLGPTAYLLGVHDAFRSGGLRYRATPDGPFLDDRDDVAAPPLVRLRELEAAARRIESSDDDDASPDIGDALRVLLAPGASLGGARPKATVAGPDGRLWVAKFPSASDTHDVGAWERVAMRLAERSGLRVPSNDARTFASAEHTFLVRRFDRRADGTRVHFASAMTLTGARDGDGAASGSSYLDLAEVLIARGAAPRDDLRELWSRIVFNMMISNADDHLRNHGFLLERGGWRLSPAYDMNPVARATGLALDVDESDNALDLDLARSTAEYYRLTRTDAAEIVARIAAEVRDWRQEATRLGIARSEQETMASAFALATA